MGKPESSSLTSPMMSQVRVGIRVRPLTSKERGLGGKPVVTCDQFNKTVEIATSRFAYDFVLDSNVSQPQLYQTVSAPLLNSFVDGFNATIIAYGQTGSGKTFTMGSEAHNELDINENSGLIPRFMSELFHRLTHKKEANECEHGFNYQLQASFLEVYGEDVHDLLDKARQSLPLRENETGGIVCAGLTARPISSVGQALEVLHEGTMNRTTAATLMNLTSSRSHAVFTVILTQHETRQSGGNKSQVEITSTSRFTFVDLAGSERMKKTGAEGERAKEGIKINEGLLALGNVINALADEDRLQEGKKIHVPYRQSKLTRLLQDALGGNSQTLFLACVSPSDTNASETLSTLRYANRARNIKNIPTRNVDATALELQRLQAYTSILQAELIKQKFRSAFNMSSPSFSPIEEEHDNVLGQCDETLASRKDVSEYLGKLQNLAQGSTGISVSGNMPFSFVSSFQTQPNVNENTTFMLTSPRKILPIRARGTPLVKQNDSPIHNKSILDDFDPALLETNPDEEMAILDQLLDIQHHDPQLDNEKKRDSVKLKQVDGELAEQEVLLLQLRKSLEVYHNMKIKYENLMAEVQQLELEKIQLAEKLKKTTADPSQGCSSTIKREMEKVEQNLARARNETRKHREMYRKAEQEAQKCKALERKIAELKISRAQLIKKQKETAARYREFTESKTREILALKKKERKTERQLSKLQNAVETYKRNLNKNHNFNNKLSEKLKQTEAHLMKLLSMKQRDLRSSRSCVHTNGFKESKSKLSHESEKEKENIQAVPDEVLDFAPDSSELDSIKFQLHRVVHERACHAELKHQYEESYGRYSDAMRSLLTAVKALESAKANASPADDLIDLEHSIEDLELKVDLASNELESLQKQLSIHEKEHTDENNDISALKSILRENNSPMLRTLLLDSIETYSETESQRRLMEIALQRKESVIQSFESEVENLASTVESLRSELMKRQKGSTGVVQSTNDVLNENERLQQNITDAESKILLMQSEIVSLSEESKTLKFALSECQEQSALARVALEQSSGVNPPQQVLLDMQQIWREVGLPPSSNERFKNDIENCLEDTCSRKLSEALAYKESIEQEIVELTSEANYIQACLGLGMQQKTVKGTLSEQLDVLKKNMDLIRPKLLAAKDHRNDVVKNLRAIVDSLGINEIVLANDLRKLLGEASTDPSDTRGGTKLIDLSESFMARCEKELSELRLRKSMILSRNDELQKECHKLINEMNLSREEIPKLTERNIKKRQGILPDWWQTSVAETVAANISSPKSVVRVEQSYSMHLAVMNESLLRISKSRKTLADKLHALIERSQQTLLKTVDGEIDASEAYSSFHETLFRLPPLSKERIYACISEVKMLNEGVDAMTQSEIEALTVVWEALFISMSERGKFWGEIDASVLEIQARPVGPFSDILTLCSSEGEAWLSTAINDGTKSYQQLECRLLKLELIHLEVERLRTRQDTKSKIISLDSEICIINGKLCEFEEKKCDKNRLTTKKDTSSNLLKEERFRKQMQSKFSSKIEQLKNLLQTWKTTEGSNFDLDILSDEVRALLNSSPRSDFMHLRTVKYKGSVKRKAEEPTLPTPAKRSALHSKSTLNRSFSTKKENSRNEKQIVRPSPSRSVRPAMDKKRRSDEESLSPATRDKKPLRKDIPNSPSTTKLLSHGMSDRKPFSPTPADNTRFNVVRMKNEAASHKNTRLTLDPFAMILQRSNSPTANKEN